MHAPTTILAAYAFESCCFCKVCLLPSFHYALYIYIAKIHKMVYNITYLKIKMELAPIFIEDKLTICFSCFGAKRQKVLRKQKKAEHFRKNIE